MSISVPSRLPTTALPLIDMQASFTARPDWQAGWAVDFVADATLTFDKRTPSGAVRSAAAIRERSETVLAGRFATLCTVAQALARAQGEA